MVEIDERDGLARQNKDVLNLDTLAADTPEVISRQVLSAKILYVWNFTINLKATINVGTIGHVAHGKSTVVKAISGHGWYYLRVLITKFLEVSRIDLEFIYKRK